MAVVLRLPAGARSAAIASGAMIAQQVAGKAARDAFFLSSFRVEDLPAMMAASAFVSLFAALVAARRVSAAPIPAVRTVCPDNRRPRPRTRRYDPPARHARSAAELADRAAVRGAAIRSDPARFRPVRVAFRF